MTRSRLFLCCLVLRGRANGNMRSNNFYIKTKTLINPRRIALLLNPVNHFSPHLASPEGEGQLLCFVIDWEMQVTLVVDNLLIISHKSICPSPSGEVRWGLDGSMLSNNNFYIKTKTKINPRRITLLLNPVKELQPPPILPRRGGTVTLLCQRLGVAGYYS